MAKTVKNDATGNCKYCQDKTDDLNDVMSVIADCGAMGELVRSHCDFYKAESEDKE